MPCQSRHPLLDQVVSPTKYPEEPSFEWLYPHARRPGNLYRDEVVARRVGNDVNIAFRWGSDDDLMFAIAVRGGKCMSTIGEYWPHPSGNAVAIKWVNDEQVRFSRNNRDETLRLDGERWVWVGH